MKAAEQYFSCGTLLPICGQIYISFSLFVPNPRVTVISSFTPSKINRPFQSRVALNLVMEARLSAKFLLRKLVFIHMQTKLIFTGIIVLHFSLASRKVRFTATRKWPVKATGNKGNIKCEILLTVW